MLFKLGNSVLICLMIASSVLAKSNLNQSIKGVKNSHAVLKGDDDEPVVFNTTIDEKFFYYNYFFKGFKSEEKMPSSMECLSTLQTTLNEYNETTSYWDDPIGGTHMYVFNITEWMSFSLAHSSRSCFMSTMEMYMWYQFKASLFNGFNSWFPAFLQNLLGQIMTFKQVEDKIEEAIDDENVEAQWYWYGRMVYMLLDFDPIDVDDTDIDDDDVPLMEIMQNLSQLFEQETASLNKQSHLLAASPVVKGIGSNGYDFIYHAMNSSIGTNSPNSTICDTQVKAFKNHQGQFFYSMGENYYNASAKAFEHTLMTLYPISTSCYYSVGEFKSIGKMYVAGASDTDQLTYNLVHRLGYISDTVGLIKATPNETPKEQEYYYKQLGNYYGHIIKLIFYSPEDYDPYDPSHDMNPNDQTIDIHHQH